MSAADRCRRRAPGAASILRTEWVSIFGWLLIACAMLAAPSARAQSAAVAPGAAASAAQATRGPAGTGALPAGISPAVYETWYFYLALLFIGITLPAHLFRRHLMKMKGRIGIILEERSRIARECHDTLMAGFAAISWQLEATSKLFADSGLEGSPAAKSCDLARSMVVHC